MENLDCEMSGRAKAEESDALTLLHFSDAEATEADDACTQQRCGVKVVER